MKAELSTVFIPVHKKTQTYYTLCQETKMTTYSIQSKRMQEENKRPTAIMHSMALCPKSFPVTHVGTHVLWKLMAKPHVAKPHVQLLCFLNKCGPEYDVHSQLWES